MYNKKNRKQRIIQRFFLIVCFASLGLFAIKIPVFAVPTINGVSGTIENDASVTVSGGSFGSHSAIGNIEWLGDNIDAGVNGVAFTKSGWTNNADSLVNTQVDYDSTQKHSGSNALKANWTGDKYDSLIVYDSGSTFTSAFVSFWVRFNPVVGGSCSQWKAWNLTSNSTGFGSTNDISFTNNQWYSTDLSEWCNLQKFFFQVNGGSTTGPGGNISPSFPIDTWFKEEAWVVKASAPNTADGTFIVRYSDGSTTYNTYNGTAGYISHMAGANEWRYFAFGKYWGNVDIGVNRNASAWYDDIYIQVGTQARVELCAESAWINRKHCEIQPPAAWSDTSATITFNQGSFNNGNTVYLYVVDADGNVNANGYELTIGGEVGDSTPPIITAFTIPSTSTSLTVSISSFTATDDTAVTGYKLTESATAPEAGAAGWTETAPTSHIFTTEGSNTLYAWAKDAAGNVSTSLNDSVTITLPTYTIGGTISDLTGTVILQNNAGDNLSCSATGSFTFATALHSSDAYAVTVLTQPTGQTCAVSSGSGTVASVNITNVSVSCADSAAPTVPSNLIGSASSSSQINLSWGASSDLNLAGYRIYRDGSAISTTSGLTFSNTGLSQSNTYNYWVTAYDSYGNESNRATVSVRTNASSSSSSSSSSKKKKKSSSKYKISNSISSVPWGGVITQSGKKFTKNGNVALYFSKPGGGYYPPKIVKASATGSFSVSARIYKPKGTYKWYAVNLATGKKTGTKSYRIR
ncbi:MAG TPA: hypothetical protein DCS28_00445 [Candidatus Moranbacteria bacterium]|nr:hypothetical protein [Candidatus Moranbacteria bacterium]HAT74500.1 hypothetical protein [Candidatus Moranbacteria bacterium]